MLKITFTLIFFLWGPSLEIRRFVYYNSLKMQTEACESLVIYKRIYLFTCINETYSTVKNIIKFVLLLLSLLLSLQNNN